MKKKLLTLCALLFILPATGFALAGLHALGYRVNLSDSMPGLIYRVTPLRETEILRRGDRVLIDLSRISNPVIERGVRRSYVNRREPMLKETGALPGDSVALADGLLLVNRKTAAKMSVASVDARGGALEAWPTPIVLSADHYWLVSDPERGFDSRYFGPLPRSAFTHRAVMVF